MNWDEVFSRLSKSALKRGELTEDEYRELLLGEDVSTRFRNMVELLREKKLSQLVKGAQFIESIGTDDLRYKKAVEKYNKISESLAYKPEYIEYDSRPTYLSVYAAMVYHLNEYGRTLKYEELRKMFSMLTAQQVKWGMFEFEDAISHVFILKGESA
ncbi:hypothetical protein AMQ84_27060 [Paenibacillus riograndensis]|uniref:Uncharacterized protein n=1 Tax=Paenibacillus riograndensis TaxID=483937 RepID=A0A132TKK6_9BACL|nr:hypothetical protein [Paenibacillus riograndensis]KWX71586.1 hypothetical protein AMQ84_27060 [Paenibacillus riograndensis]